MTELSAYLGNLDPQKPIRIYGAGFSGLIAGYFARKSGYKVEIHEKSQKAGGLIQLEKLEAGFVDSAAHTILLTPKLEELCEELGLKPLYFPKKTKRFLVRKKRKLKSFPISLSEIAKFLLGLNRRIPSQAKSSKATVKDFFSPWLGESFVDEVISTGLQGVYSETAENLHFQSIFSPPVLVKTYGGWLKKLRENLKSSPKKKSASFPKGMAELLIALANQLEDCLHFESSPPLDSQNYNNIICTNAHDGAEILKEKDLISSLLKDIPYKKITKTTVFLKEKLPPFEGAFGALFSKKSDYKTMGVINTSHLFPNRNLIKGVYQYSFLSKNPRDYKKDLSSLNGREASPPRIFEWEKGIPVYNLKRYEIVKKLRPLIEKEGVLLFGNYTKEISLRKMIDESIDFFSP